MAHVVCFLRDLICTACLPACVACSVDAAYLVTASSDCTARLWDLSSGDAIRTYSGHHKATVCCALNDSAIDGRDVDG